MNGPTTDDLSFRRIASGSRYISCFFFFSSRRRHTRYIGDWSSDVCSSDLTLACAPNARKTVCAFVALDTPLGGRSASPLGACGGVMRASVASFVAFVALWTNCFAAEPSSIEYPSVAAALSALTRDPAAHFETQGGWTIVTTVENGNHVICSFVPPGHPAYPAAAKRTVVET